MALLATMKPLVPSKRLLCSLSPILRGTPTVHTPRYICLPCRQLHPSALRSRGAQATRTRSPCAEQAARSASTSTATAPEAGSYSAPDISSHYTLFPNTLQLGPPPAGPFNIDLTSLRREFLQLQGRFHPDKYPPAQRAKAEALSARINEAYRALCDPLARAQYLLLHIYGIDVTSEDNSSHPADARILTEVMEAQEHIEEAESQGQIDALKEENRERIEATLSLLDDAFSAGNAEAARVECIRLRYWASLQEGLDAWTGKGSEVRLLH